MTRKAKVQLWGGHLDGLRANVEVGQFDTPPDAVAVPVLPQTTPLLLLSGEEAATMYRDTETVYYRLDEDHTGKELLYRVERPVKA